MSIVLKGIIAFELFCLLYIVIAWGRIIVAAFKLSKYLHKVDYDKWVYLTTLGKWGPGVNNPFRTIPYFYSHDEGEDLHIKRLKDKIRIGIRNTLNTILALIFGFIVIFLIFKEIISVP